MHRSDPAQPVNDVLERPLASLRISVTDRCNLRCLYCMPEREYVWLPRSDVLDFEEIARLTGIFTGMGVQKVRLTGGEPLLRRDLTVLVQMLAENERVRDLAMTTNGLLLAEHAEAIRRAGLHRITVSLDTLRRERFKELASRGSLDEVLAGIEATRRVGLQDLKIDTVVMRDRNDDELADLIEFGRRTGAEIRFIEYMDVGGATGWNLERVVSHAEILDRLAREYGGIEPVDEQSSAPADRYRLPDGTVFGIIGSTTTPFCKSCDRSRLTADGMWYLCLYAEEGIDLRTPLRDGAGDDEIREIITTGWRRRENRGAEIRFEQREERGVLHERSKLLDNPHLEMHTRGG